MTLIDFLTLHYWPEHALTLKAASLAQLRYSVQAFARHLKREALVSDLERLTVLSFLASRAQHVAAATVNKDRRSLLCLWRLAAELEFVKWPTRLPKMKLPQKVPHTFTPEQLRRLIDVATHSERSTFWRSLLLSLYDTGSRVSAMLSVRIRDVSFCDMTIRLRAENSKTNHEQVLPIATDTAQAIAAHTLGRDADELAWTWSLHRRRLFVHFRELCQTASVPLPPFKCFHSFRRTTATLCAAELGITRASQQLGHSSEAITRRYVDESRLSVSRWLPPRP